MHLAFLNPQGNFDPADSYWTAHPDFGGQLVYVKNLALAMARTGHRIDIVTRQVIDDSWPEFSAPVDSYPGVEGVRILRLPAGPSHFLPKEELWPHLVRDWVPGLVSFYEREGEFPDALTTHYGDGGLCGVLFADRTHIPYTFTAHSLGAQKMDKLQVTRRSLERMNRRYHFGSRLVAERLAMNRSLVNITSTTQERMGQYSHNAYRGAVDWTDDQRFAVVPPGVALDIFDATARYGQEQSVQAHVERMLQRDLAADRLGLPCIVASSRLDPKKNHLGLVQAFASSAALREQANLVLVTGNLRDPLKDYSSARPDERLVLDELMEVIERVGLRGEVSMFALGSQSELAAAYRHLSARGSVFSLTALYEPFGLAPLEAMASGLPAVVTKFGGPSESLREGEQEYGLLVDPTDPEEASAALFELVSDRERWHQMSEAGRARVHSRYTWERTAQGYLDAIEERIAYWPDGRAACPLPVHPYYLHPGPDTEITTESLDQIYLQLDVLSVGETVVDFISCDRVNSLRSAERFSRYLGGQPANVAVYVAKLGGRSAVLSTVGDDRFGDFLEAQLSLHGVNTGQLHRVANAPTTTIFSTRTAGVPDVQTNRGADVLLNLHHVSEDAISRSRAVHTSCFALSREPQRSAVRRATRLAHRSGKVVSLDPNYSARDWLSRDEAWEVLAQVLPYVDVVKPSLKDARRLLDRNLNDEELEAETLSRFHELGARAVIVTRSGGMVTVSDGAGIRRVGPLPLVDVTSVTGGRDAFWGGLLMAHLEGLPWQTCVYAAHLVAARKLHEVGHVKHLINREAIFQEAIRLESESHG